LALAAGRRVVTGETIMKTPALATATLFAALAAPALAQTTAPAASIPNFTGLWNHPSFPWFEPPASGPGPVTNKSRWPQQLSSPGAGSVALPPLKGGVGISDYDQLVGDYTNPILQPWAAEVVKKHGEMSLAGITYPNPANQCWPLAMPFVYKQYLVQVIQQPDKVTLLYNGDHEVRRIRLNERHPQPLTPSWYGNSVGHYEEDTLVVDTVGVRADHPFAMVDLFGTPYSKSLHIVERYRLRAYGDVKDAIDRNKKENWLFAGDIFSGHQGKFLQLHVTIEDEGVFTTPWTSTLTYVSGNGMIPEEVCSENLRWFPGTEAMVPKADKPDF
jgi:hypothetical protein